MHSCEYAAKPGSTGACLHCMIMGAHVRGPKQCKQVLHNSKTYNLSSTGVGT